MQAQTASVKRRPRVKAHISRLGEFQIILLFALDCGRHVTVGAGCDAIGGRTIYKTALVVRPSGLACSPSPSRWNRLDCSRGFSV